MKHRFKNFVSLIIAVSMLLSLIPLTSAALDDEFEGLETLEEIPFTFELEHGITQSEGGAHYICIIGYEEYTVNNVTESFVIIANCHYDEDILGIYAIPLDEFCQKTDILYYYIP